MGTRIATGLNAGLQKVRRPLEKSGARKAYIA